MDFRNIGFVACALLLSACQPVVYRQMVPVTTNPMGADVLVDGIASGKTPTSLDLARNQDHILTLTKSGYRQEDVTVKRVYHAEQSVLGAVSRGLSDGKFFDDANMGIQSGISSLETQKTTGEAYTLSPTAVVVTLMPVGGVVSAPVAVSGEAFAAPSAQSTLNVTEIMTSFDREMLDRALETGRSGQSVQWTNPDSGWHFVVVPHSAGRQEGMVTRDISVVGTKAGRVSKGKYPTYRENRNDWRIGYPMHTTKALEVAPVNERALLFGAAKVGASGLKPIGGEKELSHSSHSSESWGADGSHTTTTKSSSTSASVSVNPAGAIDLLEKLTE
ncbi:PEGA domain-containing protein [Desulfotalea psychrophila]|uniref:Hypothetical membrane protein n=1 Tax=Desulfotalea psychrophila (strain LSv54 / DSM 12343) TaxID=177439 RepID=Q6AQF4_DESPS|nr:PEGA domain-containing protein [Desulfotalea psychrophila]CAG35419.1 hypothetical membrane protein [Desulfotalea psychrophila LSv54]